MVALDNPAQLQLCRVNLERIKVVETKMKMADVEAENKQRVEVDNKLRQDSVTSDVSSSDEEEELFNPGRLGWSDSPDLVAWRFADYPEEEDDEVDEEGSEEDYEEDWDVSYQPAWLRISSEQLNSLQEDFRSPLAVHQGISSPHPGLRRSLSCVEISSPLTVKSFSRLENLSPSSTSNSTFSNRLSFHQMLNTSSLEDLSFVNENSNKEEMEEERIRGEGECCSCHLNQGEPT